MSNSLEQTWCWEKPRITFSIQAQSIDTDLDGARSDHICHLAAIDHLCRRRREPHQMPCANPNRNVARSTVYLPLEMVDEPLHRPVCALPTCWVSTKCQQFLNDWPFTCTARLFQQSVQVIFCGVDADFFDDFNLTESHGLFKCSGVILGIRLFFHIWQSDMSVTTGPQKQADPL